MKQLIFLFLGVLFSVAMFAQERPTSISTDVNVTEPVYFTYTLDTLTNTEADNVTIRVQGNKVQNFNAKLYLDWISGTAVGTVITQASMDGVTYTDIDTLSFSAITADGMAVGVLNNDGFLYPYLKYKVSSTGTSVVIPTLWIYTKEQ